MTLRVLALMPHPDDIEILCGGTLIRLREAGCELRCATMTPGDKGSPDRPRAEIAAIRRAEAAAAADALGAEGYTCLEEPDLEICFDVPTRRLVAGCLRRARPDIVFTTPPADYMADHEITSALVRDACFNAAVPNYEADGEVLAAIPHLYYSDAIGGTDIFGDAARVGCRVDITGVIDSKCAALACHESQREWLRVQHGLDDYVDAMRRWSARRGAECGCGYAEAFMRHAGHPHPEGDPLVELLGAIPDGATRKGGYDTTA